MKKKYILQDTINIFRYSKLNKFIRIIYTTGTVTVWIHGTQYTHNNKYGSAKFLSRVQPFWAVVKVGNSNN